MKFLETELARAAVRGRPNVGEVGLPGWDGEAEPIESPTN